MHSVVLRVLIALLLPTTVFVIGAGLMSKVSGRDYVTQRLMQVPSEKDRKPLNQRVGGYDAAAVKRHWGALDAEARGREQLFLELDLVFPFLYGAAFAASLLLAWAGLGRAFSPLWLIAPVAITMVADWTENLIQIAQLRRFAERGEAALNPHWIQIASAATMVKLFFFAGTVLLLAILVLMGSLGSSKSPSVVETVRST